MEQRISVICLLRFRRIAGSLDIKFSRKEKYDILILNNRQFFERWYLLFVISYVRDKDERFGCIGIGGIVD